MAQVDQRLVIRVDPPEARAAPGDQVRFWFTTSGGEGVAYRVQCDDAAVSSWCRVFPATEPGSGQVVVDVPIGSHPGWYRLRIVATGPDGERAATDITLRVEGERCLKFVAAPEIDLQPDGSILVTLRVLNCGAIDVNLVLQARHEGGWSFTVDPPELVVGVGDGPVTVKVMLRAPSGQKVDSGDRITVEVETGDGWQALSGRVPGSRWPWTAAVAVVVAGAVLVALLLALRDTGGASGDNGVDRTTVTSDGSGTTAGNGGPNGGGGGGDIEVETPVVDFGMVTVGESAERTVAIVNVGDQPVDVDVAVDGDQAITAQSSCAVAAAGEACDLLVQFVPQAEGAVEARVTVSGEAIDVAGEGTAVVEPPSVVSLTVFNPSTCDFTVTWDVTGGPAGELELFRDDVSVARRPVTDDTITFTDSDDVCANPIFTLVAYDAEGNEVDQESATTGQ